MTYELDVYRNHAKEMLESARKEGLNPNAVSAMLNYLDDITIIGGRGSDRPSSDVVALVTLIIDESGSMSGVDSIVKQCYQNLVSALSEISGGNDIQLSTWVFSSKRKLLNGFRPVYKVPSTINSYGPDGGTKLYDTVLASLTGQVVYSQELWKDSKTTRNIVVVISDGYDNESVKDPDGCVTKELARTLSEQGDYILAYIGLDDQRALSKEACQKLAKMIGFTEILSVDKTQRDMIDLFKKIAFAVKHASQSTELVRSEDFFN